MATCGIKQGALYLLLVYSSIVVSEVYIFDRKNPVVITSADVERNEISKSLFGYSLTHIKGFRDGGPSSSPTLFIGAPKEKSLKNSGVVWSCEFGTSADLSCSIQTDFSEQDTPGEKSCNAHYYPPDKFNESARDQWIGATLSARKNSVVTCAPRWKKNTFLNGSNTCVGETAMVGACYEMFDHYMVPHAPLDNPYYYYFQGNFNKEYLFLLAEYGLSSYVTLGDTLLVGAPCARTWTGMYLEHTPGKTSFHNFHGDLVGDSYSYLGYSLTSGRYYKNWYYIAAGGPRGESLFGVVDIRQNGNPIGKIRGQQFGGYFGYSLATADLDGDGTDELLVGAPMQSTDFTSNGGFSTGCVYVYYVLQLQNRVHLKVRKRTTKELCMDTLQGLERLSKGARFGSAMVNLGDINYDKKEDFAVSAPYNNDGVGSVFIFFGNASNSFSTLPAQVIHGKSFDLPNLHGFGNSMHSNKLDIDGNGTPDLAIGAYESGHVVVLRARPVAKATVTAAFYDSQKEETIVKFLPTQEGFRVKICVTFQFSIQVPQNNELNVWLRSEIDPVYKRFDFADGQGPLLKSKFSCVQETCILTSFRRKDRDALSETRPIQFQATLWYNETQPLNSTKVDQASITLSFPQQNKQEIRPDRSYGQAFSKFNPYLPTPILDTTSEIYRLAIAQDNCDHDGNPECKPDLQLTVKIFQDDGDMKQKPYLEKQALVIGQVETVEVSIELKNTGETAYNPVVKVTFEFSDGFETSVNSLLLMWTQTPTKQDKCRKATPVSTREKYDSERIIMLTCSRPLQTGQMNNYILALRNLKQVKVKDKLKGVLKVKVEAYPNEQRRKYMKDKSKEIQLEGQVKVDVEDREFPQSEIDPTKNIVDLTQTFILKNSKVSATSEDSVKVEILIPTFLKVKDKPVEILGIATPLRKCEAEGFTFYDPSTADFSQNGTSSSSSAIRGSVSSRSTRATKEPQKKTPSQKQVQPEKPIVASSITENIIKLSDCGKVTCRKITCTTELLSKNSREIKIKMYLLRHVAANLEQLDKITGIEVNSYISVQASYLPKVTLTGMTSRKFIVYKSIPAFIYLLSIGGGLILLILVIFGLFKCGFFRRKKREELQQIQRQTQMLSDGDQQVLAEYEPDDDPDPSEQTPQQSTSSL